MPRTGNDFRLGDVFDVDIAQVEWLPGASQRTSIFVGKTDSVIGIEYRERKSDRRFGITPSLIARYTTGTAAGPQGAQQAGPRRLARASRGALTNGSNTTEQFHFYDEIDSNAGKTVSGRAGGPAAPHRRSSSVCRAATAPQDRAVDSGEAHVVLRARPAGALGRVDVKAQWLKGAVAGQAAQDVYGLDLNGGGYLEVDLMWTPSFGVLGRGEYRDAFVWLGNERAYLTKSWRATVGVRWVLTPARGR